jgi:hypothetical protein
LDLHQIGFAMGESLAHLAYLRHRGRLRQSRNGDGLIAFQSGAD